MTPHINLMQPDWKVLPKCSKCYSFLALANVKHGNEYLAVKVKIQNSEMRI